MEAQLLIELVLMLIVVFLARVFYLLHKITGGYSQKEETRRLTPCKTLICLGSGGHTTEMLKLIENLSDNYSPRYFFVAQSDVTSLDKLGATSTVIKIPRSRVVGQAYITSVFTTLYSILYSVPLVLRVMPDLILCNGPGTCIPICLIAFLLKVLFIKDCRIVFVESFCRTETFSLTGKILMYLADNFVVQWPSLKRKVKRSEYLGQLL